jgi:hypothetical protein
MSLYATLEFLRQALNGLSFPTATDPAQAWVQPPVPGLLYPAQIYIWPSQFHDDRQTAPRASSVASGTSGFRVVTYDLSVWVYGLQDPDSPGPTPPFVLLLDAVLTTIRGLTMPTQLTDSQTGMVSWLIDIGEQMAGHVDVVRTLVDERYLRNAALLTVIIREQVQA